ncbi:MAG: glycyl aminopeptidase [Halorientalis sp.]
MTRRVAPLLVLLLVAATVPATAAGAMAAGTQGTGDTASTTATATEPTVTRAQTAETLVLTKTLSLTPERPGQILVRIEYEVPDPVVEVRATLPDAATVTDTEGFALREGDYVWDGGTANPSVTYRLPANETSREEGPLAGEGEYLFVDRGPWAIVDTPQVATGWRWRGERVTLTTRARVAGEGVVGEGMAYLGPHREHRRTASGQTFRLVVPASATLGPAPEAVLDTVSAAAGTLRVGPRDEEVVMIAAPTEVPWAVYGLQTGPTDFWVRAGEPVASANNVWIHEYVHTRQAYERTRETRWFTEASASYYAALLTLRQDRIGFDAFADRLRVHGGDEAVLAAPDTWDSSTPYRKGALVAGELDRRLRVAAEGGTLQTVFRSLNAREEPVTGEDFLTAVERAGNGAVTDAAARFTTTRATPEMWSLAAHERAFETALPRIRYAFPAPDNASGYTVAGRYRNGSLTGAPLVLAVGETLTVRATVSNLGSATGEYDAPVLLTGLPIASPTGTLAPGETRALSVTHTFQMPGNYTLAVGSARRQIHVRRPATTVVSSLDARATGAAGGATVTVTATVEAPGAVPATGTLTLTRNGTAVARRSVAVGPDEQRTVTFERTVETAGTYRYAVGNRTVTVTVGGGGDGTSPAVGPGFGALATLAGGALAVLFGRRAGGP